MNNNKNINGLGLLGLMLVSGIVGKGLINRTEIPEEIENRIDTKTLDGKVPFVNVLFEVTRKCNLKCEHCMRGEAQNLEMSREIIDKFLEQTTAISHISLTGGEPFLAPDVIEYLVDSIIEKKIAVWSFTTVNNGTILNDNGIRCIKALNKIGEYIHNNYPTDNQKAVKVSISNSKYHNNDIQKAIDFYSKYANEHLEIEDQGEWETALRDKDGNPILNKELKSDAVWLKKEGRAKDMKNAKYVSCVYKIDWHTDNDNFYVENSIQLSANGNVCNAEAISFETIDKNNFGNILEKPLLRMLAEWNEQQPLSKMECERYCQNQQKMDNPLISKEVLERCTNENNILRLKKYLDVEFRNNYKYLTKEEIYMCEVQAIVLLLLKATDKNENVSINDFIKFTVGVLNIGNKKEIDLSAYDNEDFSEWTEDSIQNNIIYLDNLNTQRMMKKEGLAAVLLYKQKNMHKTEEYMKEYFENMPIITVE